MPICIMKQDDDAWTNSGLDPLDLLSGTHLPGCKDVGRSKQSQTSPFYIVQLKTRDF